MAGIDMVRITQNSKAAAAKNSSDTAASKARDSKTAFSSLMKQKSQKSDESDQSALKADADEKGTKTENQQKTEEKKETAQTASELLTQLQTAALMGLQNLEDGTTDTAENINSLAVEWNVDAAENLAENVANQLVEEQVDELAQTAVQMPDTERIVSTQELLDSAVKAEADQSSVSQVKGIQAQKVSTEETSTEEVPTAELATEDAGAETIQAALQKQSEPKEDGEESEPSQAQRSSVSQETSTYPRDEVDSGVLTLSAQHQLYSQQSEWSVLNLDHTVSENQTTVSTTPETFAKDIGTSLADKLPLKDGELTIELEPATLGKLTIKVIYEGDRAAVSIITSNPKTLEMLSQSASEIAQILEGHTGQETMIYTPEVEQQTDWTQQGGQENQQERQQENRKKHHDTGETFAQQLRLGLV